MGEPTATMRRHGRGVVPGLGRSTVRAALAALVVAGATVGWPSTASAASAGSAGGSAGDAAPVECPDRPTDATFAPFLDPIQYFPLPDGDFEGGQGSWTFRGGARVAKDANQTLLRLGDGHERSLVLPPGASARAESLCVEGTATVMRFFARPQGLLGAVVVVVTAEDGSGARQTLLSPVIPLLPGWSAPVALFRLPLLGDHLTDVTIELRSVGLSPVSVDDIYVDPLRQR